MNGDVHCARLDSGEVRLDARATRRAVEAILRDRPAGDAVPGECEPAAQKLLHDVPPVAIRSNAGAAERLENLVVGTDRHDVQGAPRVEPFGRSKTLHGAMRAGFGARHIREKGVGDLFRKRVQVFGGIEAKSLCGRANLCLAFKSFRHAALRGGFQRQKNLPAPCAVARDAASQRTQKIAGDDKILVCATDPVRGFGRDAAWPHVADRAAGARKPEVAGSLLVKPVEAGLDAAFLHMLEHLSHAGVRGSLEHIGL